MATFKKGDTVRCISVPQFRNDKLVVGDYYTILAADVLGGQEFVDITGLSGPYYASRFELVSTLKDQKAAAILDIGTQVNCIPKTSAQRKGEPIYSGVLQYFPDALAAVSRVSKAGNDKHNPGEPLHWARDKSNDHFDCAVRHFITPSEIDPDSGEYHLAHAAWRTLAALQLLEESKGGK